MIHPLLENHQILLCAITRQAENGYVACSFRWEVSLYLVFHQSDNQTCPMKPCTYILCFPLLTCLFRKTDPSHRGYLPREYKLNLLLRQICEMHAICNAWTSIILLPRCHLFHPPYLDVHIEYGLKLSTSNLVLVSWLHRHMFVMITETALPVENVDISFRENL